MSGARTLAVAEGEAGQRLDRWLRRRFPRIPQGRVEKMCRKGEIRIDGGRVRPAARVEAGQLIRVPPMSNSETPAPVAERRLTEDDARMMREAVLHRDGHMIAINKPPGLPSQGGSGQVRHVDGLSSALRFGLDENPRLAHRLDKDTSGVLLLARTRAAAAGLARAFREGRTRKIYWAAVAGTPSPNMGTIRYGLVKETGRGGGAEKMACVHPDKVDATPGAKRAATRYATLSALGTRAAWIALAPVTGRTHQLRAHMAGIGNPIIGDGKYGGSGQENPGDGWGSGLGDAVDRRLHLHARSLTLAHPVTGESLTLTAPLPDHMKRTWEMVGWREAEAPIDPFEDAWD